MIAELIDTDKHTINNRVIISELCKIIKNNEFDVIINPCDYNVTIGSITDIGTYMNTPYYVYFEYNLYGDCYKKLNNIGNLYDDNDIKLNAFIVCYDEYNHFINRFSLSDTVYLNPDVKKLKIVLGRNISYDIPFDINNDLRYFKIKLTNTSNKINDTYGLIERVNINEFIEGGISTDYIENYMYGCSDFNSRLMPRHIIVESGDVFYIDDNISYKNNTEGIYGVFYVGLCEFSDYSNILNRVTFVHRNYYIIPDGVKSIQLFFGVNNSSDYTLNDIDYSSMGLYIIHKNKNYSDSREFIEYTQKTENDIVNTRYKTIEWDNKYLISTSTAIYNNDNLTIEYNGDTYTYQCEYEYQFYRNSNKNKLYKIYTNNVKNITLPITKSTSNGILFFDENKRYISGFVNNTYTTGTVKTLQVPENSMYAIIPYSVYWTDPAPIVLEYRNYNIINTDLKSINGVSIIGSGDISINGNSGITSIINAQPQSQGVLNSLKRAKQLLNIQWKPLQDIPRACSYGSGELPNFTYTRMEGVFNANTVYTGVPYSSVVNKMTYLGINCRLDTFITSLLNTNSKMYTDSVYDESANYATYYGTVCSGFVSYCLGLKMAVNTYSFPYIEGIYKVADPLQFNEYDIQLCDILLKSGHVAIITDILIDNGIITHIELSEQTRSDPYDRLSGVNGGKVVSKYHSVDEFFAYHTEYGLYRYEYINDIDYVSSYVSPLPDEKPMDCYTDIECMPHKGDKSIYKIGTTTRISNVKILINKPNIYNQLVILIDGVYNETIDITNLEYYDYIANRAALYTIYLKNTVTNTRSKSSYFQTVDYSRNVIYTVDDNKLSINYTGKDKLVAIAFGDVSNHRLKNYTGKSLDIPNDCPYAFRYIIESRYGFGIYTSNWINL